MKLIERTNCPVCFNSDYKILFSISYRDEKILAFLNEYYKITIKFLSNEIRSDALKISLHEKKCNNNNQCKISEVKSNKIENEISKKILRIASLYEKKDIEKLKEELGEYKVPKNLID